MFKFINEILMPSYLYKSFFDLWLNSFNDLLFDHFKLSKFLDWSQVIFIEFSNEEKVNNHGDYDIEEIKDLIRNRWKTNEKIESILNKINNYGDYMERQESLAGAICNANVNTNYDDIENTLDSWFENFSYSYLIFGEYLNCYKKIILYTNNIEKHAYDFGLTKEQLFEEVFIHELFHAYNYKDDPYEVINRYDYTSDVVLESLASFFEYTYCINHSFPNAPIIKESWRKYPKSTYPYFGAYNLSSGNFLDVFSISLQDLDNALRLLLHPGEFYYIKNLIKIREIKKKIVCPELKELKPNIYIVRNSKSFNDECANNYLYAPDTSHYKVMRNVEEGDLFFHIFKGHLHAISIASSRSYHCLDAHNRHEEGLYIDSSYYLLETPIDITFLRGDPHYPSKQGNIHYMELFNHYDVIKQIVDEGLRILSNNVVLLMIKKMILG